jgi:hypothetical protein
MINDYDPVSDIYDIYNTADYDIDFYLKRYKNFTGRALELMAGTGRLSIPLLRLGIKLDCLDISKGLLSRLKEKLSPEGLSCGIIHADATNFTAEDRYDLILIAFNSISEITDPDSLRDLFTSVSRNLSDRGEFLFTLYNPLFRRRSISGSVSFVREIAHEDKKILFFISSEEDASGVVSIRQFYEFYDTAGNMTAKRTLKLRFRLIEKDEMDDIVAGSGFYIRHFFGNFDGSAFDREKSPFMIYSLGGTGSGGNA